MKISKIITLFYMFVIIFFYENLANAESGKDIYMQNCALCHGDDGRGSMPGVPDLVENQTWSKKSNNKLLKLIKKGIETPGASMMMPPKGGNDKLSDKQLLKSIEYMRVLLTLNLNH